MINVKITTDTDWPIIKQTPGRSGDWGNYRFLINDDTEKCDYWFVLYGLKKTVQAICSKEKVFFLDGEPSSIKTYEQKFLKQFAAILTVKKNVYKGVNVINCQPGAPWMIGEHYDENTQEWSNVHTKDYDELFSMLNSQKKTKLLSVISSNKSMCIGHKLRLEFIESLKKHFGSQIDIYGRGIRTFSDKWDVIAPYKYHIVIENDNGEDYFTEKLSDCFLSESFPLYYGCNNIEEYFLHQSMARIDIHDADKSIETIENAIKNNYYERYHSDIITAKKLVLDKYNMFPNLISFIETIANLNITKPMINTIYPEEIFINNNIWQKVWRKSRKYIQTHLNN